MRPKRKAGTFEGQAGPWSKGEGEGPAEFRLAAAGPGWREPDWLARGWEERKLRFR